MDNSHSCSFWDDASIRLPMATQHLQKTTSTSSLYIGIDKMAHSCTRLQGAEEYRIGGTAFLDDRQMCCRSTGNRNSLELYWPFGCAIVQLLAAADCRVPFTFPASQMFRPCPYRLLRPFTEDRTHHANPYTQ